MRCWRHIRIERIDLKTRLSLYGQLNTHRVYDQSIDTREEFYHVNPQCFLNLIDQNFCIFFYIFNLKKGTAKPYILHRLILNISRNGNEDLKISIMSY